MCVGHLKIFFRTKNILALNLFLLLNSTAKIISRITTAHLFSWKNSSDFFVQELPKLGKYHFAHSLQVNHTGKE
jgi:hypothetical protein